MKEAFINTIDNSNNNINFINISDINDIDEKLIIPNKVPQIKNEEEIICEYILQYEKINYILNIFYIENKNIIFKCYNNDDIYSIEYTRTSIHKFPNQLNEPNDINNLYSKIINLIKKNGISIKILNKKKLILLINIPKDSIEIILSKLSKKVDLFEIVTDINNKLYTMNNEIIKLKEEHKLKINEINTLKKIIKQILENQENAKIENDKYDNIINNIPDNNINNNIFENNINNNITPENNMNNNENNNKNNININIKKEKSFKHVDIDQEIQNEYIFLFNNTYKTKIRGDEKILDLSFANENKSINKPSSQLENIGVICLSKINFKKLRKLCLFNNNISDLNTLQISNTDFLSELYLGNNEIEDITNLSKMNLSNLEILSLFNNKISDISILEKLNCNKLQNLLLKDNNIKNITPLCKAYFPQLKFLDLSYNNIKDIDVLQKVKFPQLRVIYLKNNEIENIDVLEKVNFEFINSIGLSDNKIKNINVLAKAKLPKLENIGLSNNNIEDLKVLLKLKSKLQRVYLEGINLSINDNELTVQKLIKKNVKIFI